MEVSSKCVSRDASCVTAAARTGGFGSFSYQEWSIKVIRAIKMVQLIKIQNVKKRASHQNFWSRHPTAMSDEQKEKSEDHLQD
jgi:hypothetical protein